MKLLSFNIRYVDADDKVKYMQISGFRMDHAGRFDRLPLEIGIYEPDGSMSHRYERPATNEEMIEALAKLKQLFINCGATIE